MSPAKIAYYVLSAQCGIAMLVFAVYLSRTGEHGMAGLMSIIGGLDVLCALAALRRDKP